MKIEPTITRSRWRRFAGPALVLLAAAVAVAPQLVRGPSCGHDFDFHLVSWFDALNSWRHGIFYPHWAPSPNFGAGEPRFIFYPPLTWMLGAALGLALPWQFVPVALTFLLLAGTGLATRALARHMLPDGAATLAGCAALFSGYALFNAYERTAFAEMAGGFWIPLLLLLVLRESNPAGSLWKRALDGSAAPLALVVAGCWLANVPLGVMGCYLLAAVALAAALLARSWAPVLRATVGVALGASLAGFFLLPATWEQRWVDVQQAIDDPGLRIENSWLFARHTDPALAMHDVELRKISILAVCMIAVALGGLLLCWGRGKLASEGQSILRRWWIPLALIPVAVLFFQLPISLPLWNLLPKLRFLQFPWRWLLVLEAPMAIFFAAAVWPPNAARRWVRVAVVFVCAAIFLAATVYTGRTFFQVCDAEDAVSGIASAYRSGAGFVGYDEYAPPDADDALVATGLPGACLVSDPSTVLGVLPNGPKVDGTAPAWNAGQNSCDATLGWQPGSPEHKRLRAVVRHPGFLILRLRSYPAWRVAVNGRPTDALPQRDDGLMVVPVPQGPVDLTVDWVDPPVVIAGRWLSVLAAVLFTGLWLLERKHRKFERPRLS
jgi:hypothetical protein